MPDQRSKRLGKFIAKARKDQGLSQRALAEAAGLTYGYINRLEQGDYKSPSQKRLQALARALKVDVEELYALAFYPKKAQLPGVRRYFRTKHGLSDAAIDELEQAFEDVKAKDRQRGRDG